MGLTWLDQPDELTDVPVVASLQLDRAHAEVRSASEHIFYVTAGNLFGSQTVACHSAKAAFEVLDLISSSKSQLLSLPHGVELMNDAE